MTFQYALDVMVNALVSAGFKFQQEKIQRMPPWRFLGLEIPSRKFDLRSW